MLEACEVINYHVICVYVVCVCTEKILNATLLDFAIHLFNYAKLQVQVQSKAENEEGGREIQ